jgi:hypothetical protein
MKEIEIKCNLNYLIRVIIGTCGRIMRGNKIFNTSQNRSKEDEERVQIFLNELAKDLDTFFRIYHKIK